jgi:hypothetical protein
VGTRYLPRITVEAACLACHGPQDKRPAFVKQGDPNDDPMISKKVIFEAFTPSLCPIESKRILDSVPTFLHFFRGQPAGNLY